MSVQTVVGDVGLSTTEPLYRYWPLVHTEVIPAYVSTSVILSMCIYACTSLFGVWYPICSLRHAEQTKLHKCSSTNQQAFVTVSSPGGLDTYVNSGVFQRLVQWKASACSDQKVSGSSRLCLCHFLYCSMVLTWALLLSGAGGGYKAESVICNNSGSLWAGSWFPTSGSSSLITGQPSWDTNVSRSRFVSGSVTTSWHNAVSCSLT